MIKAIFLGASLAFLLNFYIDYKDTRNEIRALKERVATLEASQKKIKPLAETVNRLCGGEEDDFYEAFFRVILEECDENATRNDQK